MSIQFQRNLGIILIGIGFLLAGLGIYGFTRPAEYAAQARFLMEKSPGLPDATDPYGDSFQPTELELIRSESVLSCVVTQLNLNAKWSEKYYGGQKLRTSETIALLRQRLEVSQLEDRMIFDVRAVSDDPVEAAEIANTVVACYRESWIRRARRIEQGGMAELQQQYEQLSQRIVVASNQVAKLGMEFEIPEKEWLLQPPQFSRELTDSQKLISKVFEAEVIHKSWVEMLAKIKELPAASLPEVLGQFGPYPELLELNKQVAVYRTALASTNHPQPTNSTELQAKLMDLEKEQAKCIQKVMADLEAGLVSAQATVEERRQTAAAAKEHEYKLMERQRPYVLAKQEFEELNNFKILLARKIKSASAESDLFLRAFVQEIDVAGPSAHPIRWLRIPSVLCLLVGLSLAAWGGSIVKRAASRAIFH